MATFEPQGPQRILVIDDNPAIHGDFRKILAGPPELDADFQDARDDLFGSPAPAPPQVRFELDSALQGLEGLALDRAALAAGRPYALAFVDVRMPPGLDGVETIGRLWEQDPDLQIVLCTAYSDYTWADIRQRLQRPASLVILKKPFDTIEVLQLAHALTGKWQLNRAMERHLQGLDDLVRQRTADLERANEALRETQALQHQLLENIPAGVLVVDPATRVIERANHQAAVLLGVPAEQLVDQCADVFLDPPAAGTAPAGEPGDGLDDSGREFVRGDGTRFPVMNWVKRIQVKGQEKLLDCFIDLSVRRQAEARLRASEARNRALISAIPDLIFTNARDGEFLAYHASDVHWLLTPPDQFLGRKPHEVLSAELAGRFVGICAAALDTGKLQEFTYTMEVKGQERAFEARVAAATGTTVISIIRDITTARAAEARQQRLQAQLAQAQKLESLGLLAGGVAHDMNNILGAILVSASANVAAQPEGSLAQRAFDRIAKAAERGGDLVKGLLSLARQNPAEEHELDLNALLLEGVNLLKCTTLAKVDLELDLDPGLRPMVGDSSALAHTFMNLSVNAVDAMAGEGRFTILTRNLDPGRIEVVLEDTGAGMPKEVLERALEPFFTTKPMGKGTGLGLSMAYATVKAHGGLLELESEPGRGTRVQMRFPAVADAVPRPERPALPQPSAAAGSLAVLLVDDDEDMQSSMKLILDFLGHATSVAPSGEEALAALAAGLRPDVVVLDLNMPGLGGAGTLPRLRAAHPDLPVLLITGLKDQTALNLVQDHPRVRLVSKPFSLKDLQRELEDLTT